MSFIEKTNVLKIKINTKLKERNRLISREEKKGMDQPRGKNEKV